MNLSGITIDLLYFGLYVLGESAGWLGSLMIVMAFIDVIVTAVQIFRK